MVTGPSVRAARALLGWTQGDLAKRAHVGVRTVKRIEKGEPTIPLVADAIERAFRDAGIRVVHDADELAKLKGGVGLAIVQAAAS